MESYPISLFVKIPFTKLSFPKMDIGNSRYELWKLATH